MTRLSLKAQEPVYGGFTIHRSEQEGITFIKGAIPGEHVEVIVEEKKRDYQVASVVEVHEPSPHRVEPPCEHFGKCGGCHIQFATYPRQVEMKNQVVVDCLRRLGGVEVNLDPPLYGEPLGYRRRGQFKVSKEGAIGFYREGTHEVIEISSCPLMSPNINDSLMALRGLGLSGAKEIHLTDGDTVMALLKGVLFDEALVDRLMDAGLGGVSFENGAYRGEGPGYVTLDLNGLKYTISPLSFLQSNWELNRKMVSALAEEIGDLDGMRLLDLYAGAGNFSLALALDARQTKAVEGNPHAISDGKRNASQNRIPGYKFAQGSAEDVRLDGDFDVLILDPPRVGLSKAVLARVLEMAPPRVAYVSCNPSTMARDMKRLSDVYAIDSVRVADMFPQTYHVECMSFMTKK